MRKAMILAAAVASAGCANPDIDAERLGGTIIGAEFGLILGSQLGDGGGQVALTLLGGAIGGMAGYAAYGSSLTPADRAQLRDTARRAFDRARDGELVTWTSAGTGVAGTVTPVSSYVIRTGVLCRDFKASIAAPEGIGRATGTACRTADGGWQVQGPGRGRV